MTPEDELLAFMMGGEAAIPAEPPPLPAPAEVWTPPGVMEAGDNYAGPLNTGDYASGYTPPPPSYTPSERGWVAPPGSPPPLPEWRMADPELDLLNFLLTGGPAVGAADGGYGGGKGAAPLPDANQPPRYPMPDYGPNPERDRANAILAGGDNTTFAGPVLPMGPFAPAPDYSAMSGGPDREMPSPFRVPPVQGGVTAGVPGIRPPNAPLFPNGVPAGQNPYAATIGASLERGGGAIPMLPFNLAEMAGRQLSGQAPFHTPAPASRYPLHQEPFPNWLPGNSDDKRGLLESLSDERKLYPDWVPGNAAGRPGMLEWLAEQIRLGLFDPNKPGAIEALADTWPVRALSPTGRPLVRGVPMLAENLASSIRGEPIPHPNLIPHLLTDAQASSAGVTNDLLNALGMGRPVPVLPIQSPDMIFVDTQRGETGPSGSILSPAPTIPMPGTGVDEEPAATPPVGSSGGGTSGAPAYPQGGATTSSRPQGSTASATQPNTVELGAAIGAQVAQALTQAGYTPAQAAAAGAQAGVSHAQGALAQGLGAGGLGPTRGQGQGQSGGQGQGQSGSNTAGGTRDVAAMAAANALAGGQPNDPRWKRYTAEDWAMGRVPPLGQAEAQAGQVQGPQLTGDKQADAAAILASWEADPNLTNTEDKRAALAQLRSQLASDPAIADQIIGMHSRRVGGTAATPTSGNATTGATTASTPSATSGSTSATTPPAAPNVDLSGLGGVAQGVGNFFDLLGTGASAVAGGLGGVKDQLLGQLFGAPKPNDTKATAGAQPATHTRPPWPVPGGKEGYITSAHGQDISAYGGSPSHAGWDIPSKEGEGVVSIFPRGQVADKGFDDRYGNYVTIVDPNTGASIKYGHLMEPARVGVGERVNQNQLIGRVGSTGVSNGPHVHFEVRDKAGNPIDPVSIYPGIKLEGYQ